MLDFIKNIFKRKSPVPRAGDYWIPIGPDTKKRATVFEHNINNQNVKTYIIPISKISKEEADKALIELIADYKDHVVFDENTGGFIIESPLVKEENDTVIRYLQDNKHNQA